ncbi:helix-turn-helix transcriptional regulator [Alsobacter metallidurans]|uniref:Helix-turn-helix transcriptional regulator n=1 Tax=Alsobacter metallidurans TaxID=340221 RepID=A0A917MGN4_9HYPH|nr:response regulator transcription factor [Alsobacter metallidurans]GGH16185.1 helix-turn-helix transcriptional regulator [Alsobacter metallidurans]
MQHMTLETLEKTGNGAPGSLAANATHLVIIDDRILMRDCLVRCLQAMDPALVIYPFSSLRAWQDAGLQIGEPPLVMAFRSSRKTADEEMQRDIAALAKVDNPPSMVVVSDAEDFESILGALELGARGYIPTSVTLEVAFGALGLVKAGGVFVPASSVVQQRPATYSPARTEAPELPFTSRQVAVAKALREGKANKIIAYELNMCESTVKVHVRNIMKKLKARNRTEVAYKISTLYSHAQL